MTWWVVHFLYRFVFHRSMDHVLQASYLNNFASVKIRLGYFNVHRQQKIGDQVCKLRVHNSFFDWDSRGTQEFPNLHYSRTLFLFFSVSSSSSDENISSHHSTKFRIPYHPKRNVRCDNKIHFCVVFVPCNSRPVPYVTATGVTVWNNVCNGYPVCMIHQSTCTVTLFRAFGNCGQSHTERSLRLGHLVL